MNLRYKVLLGTGLIWVIFLITLALSDTSFKSHLFIFIAFGIVFYVLLYGLLHYFIIKRVEQLNLNITQHRFTHHVEVEDNDEISKIATHINDMIDTLHNTENKLAHRWKYHENQNNVPFEKNEMIHAKAFLSLGHYDKLTNLPNRVFFNEILNKSIQHSIRNNKTLGIMLIDLDRFRHVKSTIGDEASDTVIKEIAKRFRSVLRSSDVIARLGADVFIILLNDVNQIKYIDQVAENLLHACAKSIKVDNDEFFITASIGICLLPKDGGSLEDLEKNADLALYKAKSLGGNTHHFFNPEITLEAHKNLQMTDALFKAIVNNEFVLYYQPKLNLINGSITGVEALIRWLHPSVGMINPESFIPLAEENGLIIPIDEWALREACRANKSWQNQGYQPITIAVNVSPKQFSHQDIVQLVSKVLEETKLDPKYLELEITETTVMDDMDLAVNKLNEIKKMGVKVSIDDFGSGYTSISYLKSFPIDVLKIDKSYIKGIPFDQNDLAITSAIIALAHSLGLQVVAEGVESVEQLQYLANQNCDMVQGYYFNGPLPEHKVLMELKKS